MNQISKKYLWIYSNRFIPLYYIRRNTKKKLVKIRADLGVPQARRKISWKYKRNGHIFGDKFVLVTTFYHVHIFRNRFGCWSAFLLFFEKTPMKTIFTAISRQSITAIYGHLPFYGHYGPYRYGHTYGLHGCLLKEQQECRSAVKTVSKNMEVVKSYDQNKCIAEIMAISLVFSPHCSASLRDP